MVKIITLFNNESIDSVERGLGNVLKIKKIFLYFWYTLHSYNIINGSRQNKTKTVLRDQAEV